MEFTREEMREVTEQLIEFGVPAHLKGYQYIRYSLLIGREDHEMIDRISKLLYPEVAKEFKTTDQKVERAIRTAIETVWKRDSEHFKEFLNCPKWTSRPTNSEFFKAFIKLL